MSKPLQLLVISDVNSLPENLLKRLRDGNLLVGLEWSTKEAFIEKDIWAPYYAILVIGVVSEEEIDKLKTIHIPKVWLIGKGQFKYIEDVVDSNFDLSDVPIFLQNQDYLLVETLQGLLKHATRMSSSEPYYTEEFLTTALGSLGDGVIVSDFAGRIQYMNHAARMICRFFGATKDIAFEGLFRIESPSVAMTELFFLEKMARDQRAFGLHQDAVIRDQEGGLKFISASMTPILTENKGDTGLVVVFRDISRIREAEKRLHLYSEVIRQSLEAVAITDSGFKLINANLKFHETFKFSEEDDYSADFFDIPGIREANLKKIILQDLLHTGVIKKQITLGIQGEIFHFRLMINAVLEDAVIYYLITFEDMTKQVEAEIRLKREQENLNAIFEGLPLGVLILDKHKRIIRANQTIVQTFGTNLDEIIGMGPGFSYRCVRTTMENGKCGEQGHCVDCQINRAIDEAFRSKLGLIGEDVPITIFDPDGNVIEKCIRLSIVLFDLEGDTSLLMVVEDITSAKKIARDLIENEHRLRLITDNMIDTVTQIKGTGEIIYASPSHWNLMGFSPEFLVGKSLIDFIHPEDRSTSIDRIRRRLVNGESFTSELRVRTKEGAYIWLESMGNVLVDDSNQTSIVYVSRDVTIKRQVLVEMQLAKEAAETANKSKSEFLANMSHEIRTPMNGIIGMTNLTLMTLLNEDQRENLLLVKNSAENLLKIINSILDFSKIEAGKMILEAHPFNLRQTLAKVINPLKVEANAKALALSVHISPEIKTIVKGDSNRLIQVLNNLLSNALKFTHSGEVRVEISKVGSKHNTTFIRFQVIDTGIGIAKEDHHKLFQSFSQVDGTMTRRYGGTGLGLSITKQLVEIMGGKIGFESNFGQGTTFSFELPFNEVDQYVISEDKDFTVPAARRHLRVLLVEDDLVNQTLAIRLLEKQQHEITLATNGEEALNALVRKDFDIILMDIQMPLMDGVVATQHIRSHAKYRNLPIIALTAHALKDDEKRFLQAGMDGYISKPILIDQFYKVIAEHTSDKKNISQIIESVHKSNQFEQLTPEEINEYIEELELQCDTLVQGVAAQQYHKCEEIAHYIKNLAVTAHDKDVKKWALRFEMAARKESIEPLEKGLEDLLRVVKERKGVMHESTNC